MRLVVVMSTYNGERYVAQQLDSVLAQELDPSVELRIHVRDDGSTDGTAAILREYERRGDISLELAGNVGVARSFIEAISTVAPRADYVALCDQDDVWHPDKLARALSLLQGRDGALPQLYCSEFVFCDEELNPQRRSRLNQRGVTFETMLYENMVSGNTTVINHRLAELVSQAGAEGVYCHDWWLALVATALGELTFDDFASLDYRRTGGNASPSGTTGLRLLRYRLRTFFAEGQFERITRQLVRLSELYADSMTGSKRALLERSVQGGRLRKAVTPVRLRQKLRDEVALRILFLMGML